MFWRRKRVPSLGFIVFGLGNPGINYAATRHNVGWWVLDELARQAGVDRTESRHHGQADYVKLAGEDCVLVKPTTLMNRSGRCVAAWLREYPEARWVVVYDDISMAPGKTRFRQQGSDGGHRGIQSIISSIGTKEFDRLKIGVGSPPETIDAADWVLAPPSKREEEEIGPAIQRTARAVIALVNGDEQDVITELNPQTGQEGSPSDPEKQTDHPGP